MRNFIWSDKSVMYILVVVRSIIDDIAMRYFPDVCENNKLLCIVKKTFHFLFVFIKQNLSLIQCAVSTNFSPPSQLSKAWIWMCLLFKLMLTTTQGISTVKPEFIAIIGPSSHHVCTMYCYYNPYMTIAQHVHYVLLLSPVSDRSVRLLHYKGVWQ